jgi:hypothetical protein
MGLFKVRCEMKERSEKLLKLIESVPADQWEITDVDSYNYILYKKIKAYIKDIKIVIFYKKWLHVERKWYGKVKEKRIVKFYKFYINGVRQSIFRFNDDFFDNLMQKRSMLTESQINKVLDELEG